MIAALKRSYDSFLEEELVDHYSWVPQARHRDGKRLLAYWHDVMARGDGFVVGRDIPARPIASLLCNILVDEILPGGEDMRIRIAGSAVRRRFGVEVENTRLSSLFSPGDLRHHVAAAHEVIATGRPMILDSSLKRGAVEELHCEVVLCPILDRDRKSRLLLVGVFYFG